MVRLSHAEFQDLAAHFAVRLDDTKTATDLGAPWYPYCSLGNLEHLARLLGPDTTLLDLAGDLPVLDVGCADGDLSFLLESLGCSMTAVDYAPTNSNGMAGVRPLKELLGSKVGIIDMDLDNQFRLP